MPNKLLPTLEPEINTMGEPNVTNANDDSLAQNYQPRSQNSAEILFFNSYLKINKNRKALKNPKYICDIKTGNIIIIHNVKESINQSRHKGGFSHPRLPLMSHLMRLFILN